MFLPRRPQPKVQLLTLPNEAILCACPVLVDPGRLNITQSMWRSKYVEILLHVNFQVARKCWQMNCKRTVYSGPLCPHLLQTSVSHFAAFHEMWSLVWSKRRVRWPASTYPWRSQVNTLAPEGMLPVTGGLEWPDPPDSPRGTELKPTVPPSHPMPHLYLYQAMTGERGTSPGNPGGWAPCFTFLFGKISNLLLAQQAQGGKSPFWASHSWVPGPLPLLLYAEPHELGQQLLLRPLLGDSLLPPVELSWAVVSQGPRLPISPHCFTFS